MPTTKLENLINPEVMADAVSAKITSMIVATPFCKIDTTLEGTAGNTITVPSFGYIGDATDVAEGVEVDTTLLTASTTKFTIKKVMKAVDLTDEAVLSGYGNPVGETNSQLAKSVASKVDTDVVETALKATLKYDGSADVISYQSVVNAVDKFNEEMNSEKVMFINPSQVTQLRLDPLFIDKTKYGMEVMVNGEIGMIANVRVVPSKKIKLTSDKYACPIIKLQTEMETEDDATGLTIYLKRELNLETKRNPLNTTTTIVVNKLYGVALTNASKVLVATFKATPKVVA